MTDAAPPKEPPGFSRYLKRARRLLQQPQRALKLLEKIPNKIRRHPSVTFWSGRIGVAMRLLQAWLRGEYTGVPNSTLTALLAALAYLVFIIDLIPDFLFWFGLLDDTAVLAYVLTRFNRDLEKFEAWEAEKALSKTSPQIVDKSVDNS